MRALDRNWFARFPRWLYVRARVCVCVHGCTKIGRNRFGPDRGGRRRTEENRPDRFPPRVGGADLAKYSRANYGRAPARCIIAGRETSVIYHKLCELLAEKLDSVN